jgi:hypothetical protein
MLAVFTVILSCVKLKQYFHHFYQLSIFTLDAGMAGALKYEQHLTLTAFWHLFLIKYTKPFIRKLG